MLVATATPHLLTRTAIYQNLLQATIANIKQLPPQELSYYLALFVAAIKNESNPEKYTLLLADLNDLSLTLDDFYKHSTPENIDEKLGAIAARLNTLAINAQVNTIPRHIQKILLNICAIVSSLTLGILGGVLGLTIGAFTRLNFIHGAYLGFLPGLAIGLTIGFRIPGKLFVDRFAAKLEFILYNMHNLSETLISQRMNPLDFYQQETKKYIIDTYFKDAKDKEVAFNAFLQSDKQKFQICTKFSGFLGGQLKNNVGHHLIIRYKINDIADTAIEFGVHRKSPTWVDQSETERTVTGQKLFDMLVLDRQLAETHGMNWRFVYNSYQAGDNDCLTYIDKILIGTQQPPVKVKRFVPQIDSWVGDKIVGNLIRFFSKTSEKELDTIVPWFADGNEPKVSFFTRPGSS